MSKKTLLNEDEFNLDKELVNKELEEVDKSEALNNVKVKDISIDEQTKPKYLRLALTEDSHKYLSLLAEQSNQSMTKYINMLIDKDKKKNKVLYEKLIEIENQKIEALKNI